MDENPEPRASCRSCRVVFAIIRGLHKNLSGLYLIARGGDVFLYSGLLSLPNATFSSLWFQGMSDRCRCSGVRLISLECWLNTCAMFFGIQTAQL